MPLSDTMVMLFGIVFIVLTGITFLIYDNRYGPRARLRKRVVLVIGKAVRSEKGGQDSAPKRKQIQEKLKELEDKQKRSERKNRLLEQIEQAGLEITLQQYFMFSGGSCVVALAIHFLLGYNPWGAIPVAIVAGVGLPKYVVGSMGKRRRQSFTKYFADGLDVICRGIQSGLPLGECLNIIARVSPDPVGAEFRLITERQKLGVSLENALDKAHERMPTPDPKFFAIVLSIQQQTGGNLAETLTNLSTVLRDRKQMANKVKAITSEARATAMIIGSLPFCIGGMLYLIEPEYIVVREEP